MLVVKVYTLFRFLKFEAKGSFILFKLFNGIKLYAIAKTIKKKICINMHKVFNEYFVLFLSILLVK